MKLSRALPFFMALLMMSAGTTLKAFAADPGDSAGWQEPWPWRNAQGKPRVVQITSETVPSEELKQVTPQIASLLKEYNALGWSSIVQLPSLSQVGRRFRMPLYSFDGPVVVTFIDSDGHKIPPITVSIGRRSDPLLAEESGEKLVEALKTALAQWDPRPYFKPIARLVPPQSSSQSALPAVKTFPKWPWFTNKGLQQARERAGLEILEASLDDAVRDQAKARLLTGSTQDYRESRTAVAEKTTQIAELNSRTRNDFENAPSLRPSELIDTMRERGQGTARLGQTLIEIQMELKEAQLDKDETKAQVLQDRADELSRIIAQKVHLDLMLPLKGKTRAFAPYVLQALVVSTWMAFHFHGNLFPAMLYQMGSGAMTVPIDMARTLRLSRRATLAYLQGLADEDSFFEMPSKIQINEAYDLILSTYGIDQCQRYLLPAGADEASS